MKNLIKITFIMFLLASCSKDAEIIDTNVNKVENLGLSPNNSWQKL